MFAKLLCCMCGARIIDDIPPELPVAMRRLRQAGFTIPPFQMGFKKLPRHVSAEVVTKMGTSCVIIDEKWKELDNKTKTHTLIHELLHAYDENIIDIAYRHEPAYDTLTFAQLLQNADSLATLINEETWNTTSLRDYHT